MPWFCLTGIMNNERIFDRIGVFLILFCLDQFIHERLNIPPDGQGIPFIEQYCIQAILIAESRICSGLLVMKLKILSVIFSSRHFDKLINSTPELKYLVLSGIFNLVFESCRKLYFEAFKRAQCSIYASSTAAKKWCETSTVHSFFMSPLTIRSQSRYNTLSTVLSNNSGISSRKISYRIQRADCWKILEFFTVYHQKTDG